MPFTSVASDPKMTAFGKGLLEDVAAKLSQLSANHDFEVVPARTLEDRRRESRPSLAQRTQLTKNSASSWA